MKNYLIIEQGNEKECRIIESVLNFYHIYLL